MKNRGIRWVLLDHITRFAAAKGIRRLQSIESVSDLRATRLEREAGFTVRSCPDDPTLVIAEKQLA
jgi:hypothetical protein